ncbi:unnamed protein product [Caenorhabditis auriculariae]|uniref:Helicase C-terminal domain-containing protein n=1 Tax=Caenorhabditis auriculariae TaxID=2777116 RepID=A0A8S1GSI4_9PELO|nr:unnamed protein product [Caenorhabditis auriculariae]
MLTYFAGTNQWFADGHEAIKADGEAWSWKEGLDFMQIDGSVQSGKRDAVQTKFNNARNLRARLMLISTRAGSLGTNMVAANRVVIFDACWNPSHDTQSLFRVYRFGQTKPVYIYRLIAHGTMEERIYKRQVTKESTSMRVVDEAQIQRHYDGHDLQELYQFNPSELDEDEDIIPTFAPPKDRLLADVLRANKTAVVDYFQHDTLFAQVEEEKLTDEEMKDAWDDYEREKTQPAVRITANASLAPAVLQRAQAAQMADITKLLRDVVFMECMKVPQMDVDRALKVTYLKKALDDLMPTIPMEMRGGMNEFGTHFIRQIHNATANHDVPQQVLTRAVETFQTVVKMTRQIPQCHTMLRHLYQTTPQFFDPAAPPFP